MSSGSHHLDELLQAWGQRQRLTAAEADQLRTTLLEARPTPSAVEPAGLPADWWADFSRRMGDVMLQAVDVPQGVPAAA